MTQMYPTRNSVLDIIGATYFDPPEHFKFRIGDKVKRKKGNWRGVIVGYYSTGFTPEGYCVMSVLESGAVHVEPINTLEEWDGRFGMLRTLWNILNAKFDLID